MTLVAFLTARLNEDEQYARACRGEEWAATTDNHSARPFVHEMDEDVAELWGHVAETYLGAEAKHIARHDPKRVLAEIETKRRILTLHTPALYYDGPELVCPQCSGGNTEHYYVTEAPCETIRLLATPYADHPDFKQEWA